MQKEVRKIASKLQAQGWTVEETASGRGRHKATPPDADKPAVMLPANPRGGRWRRNLIQQLRRSGADL